MGLLLRREKEAGKVLFWQCWDTALRCKRFPAVVRWPWELTARELGSTGKWAGSRKDLQGFVFNRSQSAHSKSVLQLLMIYLEVYFSFMEQYWRLGSLLVSFSLYFVEPSQVLPISAWGQFRNFLQNPK